MTAPQGEQRPARGKLATPAEVAEWLQVDTERLRQLRKSGRGPNFIKLDRKTVRYAWADVHAWCAARRAASTGGNS